MTEQDHTPRAEETTALARVLFGWTRAPGAGPSVLAALAIAGGGFVAAEYLRPRLGLQLPYEALPGFYAAVGAGAVVVVLLAAAALRWVVEHEHPYTDEARAPPPKPDAPA